MNAIEVFPEAGRGRFYSERLQERGVLAKETHDFIIRFAPPLVIEESDLDLAIATIREVFSQTESQQKTNKA
jgi:ornithine--oxo-acid transaminase